MRYEYITKIEIKFDKKKTFKRKSIKYLQNFIFQESVKLPGQSFVKLILQIEKKSLYLQSQYGNGALAERLGTGLQNLLQRFDSARHLTKPL